MSDRSNWCCNPCRQRQRKEIKQKAVKKSKVERSAEGTEASHGTKRRKIASACKQLVIFKALEEADPFAIEKEVSHPPIPKIRVKTKLDSSILQIPMGSLKGTSSISVTSLAQGSLGSFDIIPRSPQGPFRRTRNRQKTVEESVEREKGKASFLLLSFIFLGISLSIYDLLFYCVPLFPFLFTDEWSLFFFVV